MLTWPVVTTLILSYLLLLIMVERTWGDERFSSRDTEATMSEYQILKGPHRREVQRTPSVEQSNDKVLVSLAEVVLLLCVIW